MLDKVKETWGSFKEYWHNNLKENYKTVSKSFGSFLITTITAIGTGISNYFTQGSFGWSGFIVMMVGASIMFATITITSIFGKQNENNE